MDGTFFGSRKLTWPVAIEAFLRRLDHCVYITVTLSFLLPERVLQSAYLSYLGSLGLAEIRSVAHINVNKGDQNVTFNGVGFSELRAVFHQCRRKVIPFLARLQPKVDMCAREVVGVELRTRHVGFVLSRMSLGGRTHTLK